jgi:hypothetical protein
VTVLHQNYTAEPFLRCWKKATNPSQVMGRVQRAWGAFAEVTTGLGCAFVHFGSPEARAAWPAELSPRCYGSARGERAGASFQLFMSALSTDFRFEHQEGGMSREFNGGTTFSSTELYLLRKHYGLTERSTKGGLGGSTVGPEGPPAGGSVRESCSEG